MSLHRRAAKRDDAEPDVVEAFLDGGATVIKHSGKDECDLVIGYRGRNHCVEVKTGNRQPSPEQAEWARQWRGGPVLVIRNEAQARKAMRMWDQEAADTRCASCSVEAREDEERRVYAANERSGT